MKSTMCFITFLFFSCSTPTAEKKIINPDSSSQKVNNTSATTTEKGTPEIDFSSKKENNISLTITENEKIIIYSDEYDTTVFSKGELKEILKYNPEINEDILCSPDIAYAKKGSNLRAYPDSIRNMFESEAGEDEYFELYAYYLKNRNGNEKYNAQRKRLMKIYLAINDIFGYLDYATTYYAHQHRRIAAYAEYSIYSQINTEDYYVKQYDYSKQKEIYIQSLRQLVKDEVSIDNMTLGKDKIERKNEILEIINNLNVLISDYSDLKFAQRFQYSNY